MRIGMILNKKHFKDSLEFFHPVIKTHNQYP